jgi:hypothetical protein
MKWAGAGHSFSTSTCMALLFCTDIKPYNHSSAVFVPLSEPIKSIASMNIIALYNKLD